MTSVQKFDRSLVAVACVVASGLLAYLAVDNYREAEFRKINAETEYRIDRTYDELVRIKFLIDRMEAR